MIMRQDLYHNIVGNEFLFVERCQDPPSKGLIKSSDINLWEPCEYVPLPVAVGEDPMQMQMKVKGNPRRLYCKDTSQLTLIDTEYLD